MAFRIKLLLTMLTLIKFIFATAPDSSQFESLNFESNNFNLESKPLGYNPELDPFYDCNSWSFWCNLKYGLKKAESNGVNGIMINGYAYHPIAGWHWPTGYATNGQLNEVMAGGGYTRTFYNPQYNTEYILYAMAFMDSFYKPEVHVGYAYQKYFDLNDSGLMKWGIGYTPFVFVKSSMIGDAPIPLPAVGLMTSFKVSKFNLMLTYFNVLFLNARVDL